MLSEEMWKDCFSAARPAKLNSCGLKQVPRQKQQPRHALHIALSHFLPSLHGCDAWFCAVPFFKQHDFVQQDDFDEK
jgi:hypothetical protein